MRYPRTPNVTTYDAYTAAGDPGSVKDPNNSETLFTYTASREVATKTTSLGQWVYTWENGELAKVESPQDNIEVFCHRVASSCSPTTTCDTSLQWSKDVQWQAKFDSTQTTWSELTSYCRWPNGSLKTVSRYANNGGYELRAEQSFDEDAERRPTWSKVGSGSGAYTATKAFDGASNLAAVGLAFNGAPSFCKTTGGALDEKCAWLKYDRANRLSELDVYPDGTSGSQIRSCFDHDHQGNVSRVSIACDAGTPCNFDGGLSACSAASNDYKYDDFGNVVEASLANTTNNVWTEGTGKGWVRYAYDAFGNMTEEVYYGGGTLGPNTVSRTYDMLGRLVSVTSYPYEAATLVYDDASVSQCGTLTNTKGRLVMRVDAIWTTYYSYDVEGRVIREARHRTPLAGDCPSLDTVYTYSANGNLASVRYPHGRTVTYGYPSSGAGVDRPTSISVTLHNGTSFSSAPGTTLIDSIAWEPYGGLRAYVNKHDAGTTSTVEYMLGDISSQAPSDGGECVNTVPSVSSGYDYTARLRSLRVSNGSSLGGAGEIFKRLYTWQADQVSRMDTCYRNDNKPITEVIGSTGYDNTLQLKSVSAPNFGTNGGWHSGQSYVYDARGNKTRVNVGTDGGYYGLTYSTAAHLPDRLLREADGGFAHNFDYDSDGFVWQTWTPGKTPSEMGAAVEFYRRAAGMYHSAEVWDGTYKLFEYDYDVFNRRISKRYPADTYDWFFYDTGHQLLEDLGNATTVYPGTPYAIDEYVWLDGRPIAVIRAKMDASLARSADGTGNCARNGQSAACDTYFITTDHIGKPVLTLDGRRLITGVGEYEPFGAMNRSEYWWGTDWTYDGGSGDTAVVPRQQAHGLTTAFRAHFTRFDSEQTCTGGFVDGIQASDNNAAGSGSNSDCVAAPSGLVSWWRGEGNSNDTGPNGNHGSLSGGAVFGVGKVGLGFHFDGYPGTRFSAPTNGLPAGGSDRTIEFWAQIDGVSLGSPTPESAWFAGYGTFGYYNECYAAVAWAPGYYSSGFSSFFSQWGVSLNGPTLSTGSWYHIAVTTSSGYSTFWVNGVEQESGYLTVDTPSGTTFFMGGIDALGDITRLNGSVDELSVYDRALSESEIDSIYAAGSAGKCGCGSYSGHLGEAWTTWCPTRESDAGFSEYRLNWHTNATNCQPGNCSCGTNTAYGGFTMRDYEYQRYQQAAGAQMYFPPLRFPGQYFDEETHLHENWNRLYFPPAGRYLQPEPLFESPSTILFQTKLDPRTLNAYAYASNNPINRYDDNGLMDSQAKRDGQPNQLVRKLETPLRKELSERCAKEQTQQLDECRKKANQAAGSVQCDPKGGAGAKKEADEKRIEVMKSFNCDKGAKCEYEACLAGANSGVGTTDYMRARQRCMSQ